MGGCDVSQDRGEPNAEIAGYGITSHINMQATRPMGYMYMTLCLLIYYLSECCLLHWNEYNGCLCIFSILSIFTFIFMSIQLE